jgi:hypothetical protein
MSLTGWARIAPSTVPNNALAFIASSFYTGPPPGTAMWLFATGLAK